MLPARLYHVDLATAPYAPSTATAPPTPSEQIFARMILPQAMPVATYPGEPLRFLHIIKTGGESLQGYLDNAASPSYDFSTCRAAAMMERKEANSGASSNCVTAAAAVSTALCGLNCECCAASERRTHPSPSPHPSIKANLGHCIQHHAALRGGRNTHPAPSNDAARLRAPAHLDTKIQLY